MAKLTPQRVSRRVPTALERLLGKCEKVCAYLEHPEVTKINFALPSTAAARSLRISMDEVWAIVRKVAEEKRDEVSTDT